MIKIKNTLPMVAIVVFSWFSPLVIAEQDLGNSLSSNTGVTSGDSDWQGTSGGRVIGKNLKDIYDGAHAAGSVRPYQNTYTHFRINWPRLNYYNSSVGRWYWCDISSGSCVIERKFNGIGQSPAFTSYTATLRLDGLEVSGSILMWSK